MLEEFHGYSSLFQTGIISPSKLRMKLMAPHHKKKDGSNSNSSRTSPSKLEDTEFVRNSLLLATENGGFEEEGLSPFHLIYIPYYA